MVYLQFFLTLIKNMYEGFTGHVIFNGQVSEGFQIGTGVQQGCLLSPQLFLIAVDWAKKRSTEHHRTGIQSLDLVRLKIVGIQNGIRITESRLIMGVTSILSPIT